jgi:hypothetical protein
MERARLEVEALSSSGSHGLNGGRVTTSVGEVDHMQIRDKSR